MPKKTTTTLSPVRGLIQNWIDRGRLLSRSADAVEATSKRISHYLTTVPAERRTVSLRDLKNDLQIGMTRAEERTTLECVLLMKANEWRLVQGQYLVRA